MKPSCLRYYLKILFKYVRHLRSSSYRTLAVPRTRTTVVDGSFAVAGPHVWNSLPAII